MKKMEEFKVMNRKRPEKQGFLVSTLLKEKFDNIRCAKAEELKRRISIDETFELILKIYEENK